jgi:hypothetical protein
MKFREEPIFPNETNTSETAPCGQVTKSGEKKLFLHYLPRQTIAKTPAGAKDKGDRRKSRQPHTFIFFQYANGDIGAPT